MNDPIFVVPWREQLFPLFQGKAAVVVAGSLDEIQKVMQAAKGNHIDLRCLMVRTKAPLASLPLQAELAGIPLAFHPSRLGRFQDLVRVLPMLRTMNARIVLSADEPQNLTGARILSSLGIETVVDLDGAATRWDLLTDLMTYALLGIFPHAPIEPFRVIAERYHPQEVSEWSNVYFDDPSTYLHVNGEGRVAVTRALLEAGRCFAGSPAEVTASTRAEALEEHRQSWRRFFLERSRCAACQGWRICRGRYSATAEKDPSCSAFFVELMDVVDRHKTLQKKPKELWRF